MKSNGDLTILTASGPNIRTKQRLAGTWQPSAAWTNTAATITGLALFHWNDWNAVLTGTEVTTTHPRIWSAIFGDGAQQASGTWSALRTIAGAAAGSALTFQRPSAARTDTVRAAFVERFAPTAGAYDRVLLTNVPVTGATLTYDKNLWREPQPFNSTALEGAALVQDPAATAAWLTSPSRVWRAPLPSAAGQDLTPHVLAATITEQLNDNGQAIIDLDNTGNRFAVLGSGANADLKLGSFIRVRTGYTTTAGNEVPDQHLGFWVEDLTHITEAGKAILRITAMDAWGLLERWRSPRFRSWTAVSVNTLLENIAALAGLQADTSLASAPAGDPLHSWAILPGTSAADAIRSFLPNVRDRLRLRGELLQLLPLTAVMASDFTVSRTAGDIPLLASSFKQNAWDTNHALVFGGAGVYGEALNFPQIDLATTRVAVKTAKQYTTEASADQLANDLLRSAEVASRGDQATTPTIPALELADTADITEPAAALDVAFFKITGARLTYKRGPRSIYTHTLTLGPN